MKKSFINTEEANQISQSEIIAGLEKLQDKIKERKIRDRKAEQNFNWYLQCN